MWLCSQVLLAARSGLLPSSRDHDLCVYASSVAAWLGAVQNNRRMWVAALCVCMCGALQQANGSNKDRPKRAVGVQASFNSSSSKSNGTGQPDSSSVRLVVHAPIVVSSCGSIHTPALLLRSGITGGGTVGTNLRLHPATGLVAQFDRTPEQAAAGKGAVNMYTVSGPAACWRSVLPLWLWEVTAICIRP